MNGKTQKDKRKINSIKQSQKNISTGCGQMGGDSYYSGIYTYEVPSKEKVARVRGLDGRQVHHCLSQHEKHFLTILMYDSEVSEIRDQILLPLEDTLALASLHGLRHPYADQCPAVLSTDFYYCKNGHWQAIATKTTRDLSRETVPEKLELERLYWEKEGIPWRIVTEEDIPRTLSNNLRWLHSGMPLEELVPDPVLRWNLLDSFLELFQDYAIPFPQIISVTEDYVGLQPGTMIQAFKHLIKSGRIQWDLSKPINLPEPRDFEWLSRQIESRHSNREDNNAD